MAITLQRYFIKIGINTLIQSSGKIFSIGIGFVSIYFLTRYLGPTGYGNYTLIFVYISLFSIISDFGLQLIVIRELSQDNEKHSIYGTYLYLKFILVIVSIFSSLIFLFILPYSHMLKIGIIIGTLAVAVSNLTTFGNTVFQVNLDLPKITLIDNITKLFTVLFTVFFTILKLNFYFIVSTVFIGNLTGLLLCIFFLNDILPLPLQFNKHKAKTLLVHSIPVGFTSLFAFAYFKVDTLMLSLLKNSTEVGLYSLAYKCLENLLVFWSFYMATVYPLMAKFKGKDDNKNLKRLLQNSILIALISSLVIVLIAFVFTPEVINLFGGNQFSGSILALKILLFTLPFQFINNLFYSLFLVYRRTNAIVIGMLVALIFNILLNLIFIPSFGYIAASYITIISEALLTLCYIIFLFFSLRTVQK